MSKIWDYRDTRREWIDHKDKLRFGHTMARQDFYPILSLSVYAWLDGEEIFYIGCGSGWRCIMPHIQKNGLSSAAELHRERIGQKFQSLIIQDGLSRDNAILTCYQLVELARPGFNDCTGASNSLRQYRSHQKQGGLLGISEFLRDYAV